ncbi:MULTISPECIES: T9SS type A sorting domain-containing protein [Chryseobacterium]|uniref:T9SS type A sorting domain-containing protein n=1 Tax=Chryseobacterium TaxID=59732 RepID=UPI001BE6C23A|nr:MULTISPECIES: T9SS type A sorting domain-containing protein [Chryseobacterium]MBT2621459.1 T9SS type A sorting domain-containing protein [Chryseobacterium sp. ISL-6]
MKKIYLLVGFLVSVPICSQSLIGGINSGGVSNENLMHTVGEIYVIPTNPDDQNSGTIGVLYQTVLNVLGVNEIVTEKAVSIYPNPTAGYINFNVSSSTRLEDVSIYDMSGKLVSQNKIVNNKLDLSFLLQGIYILKFNNSELKPVKIIKK